MKYLYTFFKSLLLVAFLSTSVVAKARPIDRTKAQIVGFSFLTQRLNQDALRSVADCRLVYQSVNTTDEGYPYYYVFNAVNSFVIVSGDDRAVPVLAYSTDNVFDVEDIPETMRFYLDLYEREIKYAVVNDEYSVSACSEDWASLLRGESSTVKGNRAVEPLLGGIIWHQNCYYNDLCPADSQGPCGHVYAGCVATAMAMIMKYWGQPSMGFGSHTYQPSGYPEQSVDYSAAYYNYDIMPNQLTELSTAEEISAVAELQWHCGVAVDMMYGNNGSGAYSNYVPDAMRQYFGYDESIEIVSAYSYSLEQWKSMLRESFDAGVPLFYCGQDEGGAGGHAFVCDGYDDNDMFHFNWGWNGNGNGYYALGALNPSNTNYAFNSSVQAVINMYPSATLMASPNAPTDFIATAVDGDEFKADLSWVNPTHTIGGDAITSLLSIQIVRNGSVVGSVNNPIPGEACTWQDNDLTIAGLYEYEIYAVSESGNGASAQAYVTIGDVCLVRAELRDSFGDGWNGASLEFTTPDGASLVSLTITTGASLTKMVGLPMGMIDCVWHRGSYDTEISFSLYDSDDELIYACPNALAINGVFHSFDNQCTVPVSCGTPECFVELSDEETHTVLVSTSQVDGAIMYKVRLNNEVVGEITAPDLSMLYTVDNICQYLSFTVTAVCQENGNIGESMPSQPFVFQFAKPEPPVLSLQNDGEMVILDWTVVHNATYNVYRNGQRIKANLIFPHYEDEDVEFGNYCYTVTCNCLGESTHSNEQCTEVLGIDHQDISLQLYPNPADDTFVVASPLLTAVEVYDVVGNLVVRVEGSDSIALNTSAYKAGLYVVRVQLGDKQTIYRSLMIAH